MNGVKDGKGDMVKSVVMDGVKSGKFGKIENCVNDEETMSQSEERLCKSIMRGLVKRNHEKHTMLADVGEKQEQDVICFDDITGKELPGHAVRQDRELELKYLRDLGVYEKVDERKLLRNMESLQWTRRGLTQTKRLRESQCKSDHECVRKSSKAMIGQTCVQGLLHWRR